MHFHPYIHLFTQSPIHSLAPLPCEKITYTKAQYNTNCVDRAVKPYSYSSKVTINLHTGETLTLIIFISFNSSNLPLYAAHLTGIFKVRRQSKRFVFSEHKSVKK